MTGNRAFSPIISIVSRLLEVCNERVSGYKKAASQVKDEEIKQLFEQIAIQTEGFSKQLLQFINHTKLSHTGTSTMSELWEAWIGFKSSLTNGSRRSMLDACLTGEAAAIKAYRKALTEKLPTELKEVIFSQMEQIENTYKNIKSIRQSLSKL
jgi:uncharacterized protein (TIGR02284 family)